MSSELIVTPKPTFGWWVESNSTLGGRGRLSPGIKEKLISDKKMASFPEPLTVGLPTHAHGIFLYPCL